ncbi:MAG: hypothetical protein AAGD96_03630, partial [Chloroflexota bacterium]
WKLNQTTYFNGASISFTEAWLDEEDQSLKILGVLGTKDILYPINNLYHTQGSDAKLMLEGQQVKLTYPVDTLEQTSYVLFLQATIQYEDALSIDFLVSNEGVVTEVKD